MTTWHGVLAQINGNNKLKAALSDKADPLARRNLLRDAIKYYTDGLTVLALGTKPDSVRPEETQLGSQLLSNRAHVESLLGGWAPSSPPPPGTATGAAACVV